MPKPSKQSKANGDMKPDLPFMRWWEANFQANQDVQRMPKLARLMYRSLLQRAWLTKTAPYIPDNDAELMFLADAPSPEDWERHKSAVVAMFKTSKDGEFLYHDKTVGEYERAQRLKEKNAGGREKALA